MDDGKRVGSSTRVSETTAGHSMPPAAAARSAALDAALSMWLAAKNGARPPAARRC